MELTKLKLRWPSRHQHRLKPGTNKNAAVEAAFPAMTLCSLCNNLEKKDEDLPRLAFDFMPIELVQSATRGCIPCAIILEGLQSSFGPQIFENLVRRVYTICRTVRDGRPGTLSARVYFNNDNPSVELEYFSCGPEAWKAIMPRRSISGHPLAPHALAWVNSKLDKCQHQHDHCRNLGIPRLPTRLLSLSHRKSLRTNERTFVRLVEKPTEYVPYAALSHCWGKDQTCTTTLRTLESRKQGIPWTTIPKTFQDAMIFALKMNIKYIWIDSLCIVQDDPTDWDIESMRMADVYQNSFLTLAATASPGDSYGCYDKQPMGKDASEIRLSEKYPEAPSVAVRNKLEHWETVNQARILKDYPLLSRAWVFQERLLSPRVLHICSLELVWECRQATECECGNQQSDGSLGGLYHDLLKKTAGQSAEYDEAVTLQLTNPFDSKVKRMQETRAHHLAEMGAQWPEEEPLPYEVAQEELIQEDEYRLQVWRGYQQSYQKIIQAVASEEQTSELSRQWHRFIEQYSDLDLTKPTDRLPALSGLCERVSHLRGDYIAGVWTDSLCFDLLWRVDILKPGRHAYSRSGQEIGPSWSWASVQHPVRYWDDIKSLHLGPITLHEEDQFNKIAFDVRMLQRRPLEVRYGVRLVGHNQFGQVSLAVLRIKSHSRVARLLFADANDPMKYRVSIDGTERSFYADYVFNELGTQMLVQFDEVTLLLIHPQIALVIVPAPRNTSQIIASRNKLAVTVGAMPEIQELEEGFWTRIGIIRVSDTLLDLYGVDWMSGAVVSEFNLV